MRERPCHARTTPSLACGSGSPRPLGAVHGGTPALCHVLSCSPCRRRSSAVPFLHIVPSVAFRSAPFRPRRRRPGRPQAAGQFLRAYPACAPVPARARLAPARFAHLIARARRRPRTRNRPLCRPGGSKSGRTPASLPLSCICHVPHAAAEALRFRSCISFLRRVPFRSCPSAPPPAWATPSGGTVFARVSCVRACARPRASCAGAVRAPDCARETPDARRPFVPAGAFFGPSHCFPAQKSGKAAPEAAFSLPPSYYSFSPVKLPGGRNMKIFLLCRRSGRSDAKRTGTPCADPSLDSTGSSKPG